MALIFSQCTSKKTQATNSDFQVDVKEILSVSVTAPTNYATGDPGIFLRDKITVEISSNNIAGFVAGVTAAKTNGAIDTNLRNGSYTIPTLANSITCTSSDPSANNGRCTNFTDNHWGYSLNDTPSYNGTYKGVSTAVDKIFDSSSGSSRVNTKSGDVYVGTRATGAVSGTYTGAVSIIAISGATNITTEPTNPATPEEPTKQDDDEATYTADADDPDDSNKGTTVFTTTDEANNTKTEISQVTKGDTTSLYPLGETKISTSGSNINLALALTATATATAGFIFFIVAKRREDDEDEEEQ